MKVIQLFKNKGAVLVDDEDYSKLSEYKWYLHGRGYATTFYKNKNVLMHRMLLEPKYGDQVDHIDGNRLNNQRDNLRICTASENVCNTGIKSNNTSGYVGVSKNGNRWQANIYKDGKRYYIGSFATAEEASVAYQDKASELHGEFRR